MSRMAVLGTLGYVKDDISRESWLCQGWQFWVLLVMSRMTFLGSLGYVRDGSFRYSWLCQG